MQFVTELKKILIFLVKSYFVKGVRFERQLLHKLWDNGFAAIRSPASGAISYPVPDIIAGNGKRFLAIEVKMRKSLPLYLKRQEIKELVMFSTLFGAEPFVAIKILKSDWRFVSVSKLKETNKGYKVDEEVYNLSIDFNELIGKSIQKRLE